MSSSFFLLYTWQCHAALVNYFYHCLFSSSFHFVPLIHANGILLVPIFFSFYCLVPYYPPDFCLSQLMEVFSPAVQTSRRSKHKLMTESISNTTATNEQLRRLVMDCRATRDECMNAISNQLKGNCSY